MDAFGNIYSKYYNLLYKDKDYRGEYEYICELIQRHGTNKKIDTVLDIGCGTGKHLKYFKDAGYSVFGIDLSENMLSVAKENLNQEENIVCCPASGFNFNIKFNVIISLFHVMSYQVNTDELEKVFFNVQNHLDKGGLFIFDFWYGPAVLSDPPVVRIKRLEDEKIKIARLAEPAMHYNENIVDVNYELFLEDKGTHYIERIAEKHKIRYLFLPELKRLALNNNFLFVNAYQWLDFSPLSEKTWYGCAVLKK
jgi:SAM-dependent methyltransferase